MSCQYQVICFDKKDMWLQIKQEVTIMKQRTFAVLIGSVAFIAIVGLWVGCEESPTNVTINITPPLAATTNWTVVRFVASLSVATNSTDELYYPLEWSMSDPNIGRFRSAEGDTAVYETVGWPGVQTITVRDQAGHVGTAGVAQSAE